MILSFKRACGLVYKTYMLILKFTPKCQSRLGARRVGKATQLNGKIIKTRHSNQLLSYRVMPLL